MSEDNAAAGIARKQMLTSVKHKDIAMNNFRRLPNARQPLAAAKATTALMRAEGII